MKLQKEIKLAGTSGQQERNEAKCKYKDKAETVRKAKKVKIKLQMAS